MTRQELVNEMIYGTNLRSKDADSMLQVFIENIDEVVESNHNCSCPPCGCGYRIKQEFLKE